MAKPKNRQRLLELEAGAIEEHKTGANKKVFHSKDLVAVNPLTPAQEQTFHSFHQNHLFLYGSAGTGKSFLALYLALRESLDPDTDYKKTVIIRSIVPSRDSGHLPGTKEEKAAPYEAPYRTICNKLFTCANSYDNLKKNKYLSFETTDHLRGDTIDDAVVIIDEIQNMNFQEADTIITRMGKNVKVIFAGDLAQTDLNKKNDRSGMPKFMSIIEKMNDFDMVRFMPQDIVRSGLVKAYILAKEAVEGA